MTIAGTKQNSDFVQKSYKIEDLIHKVTLVQKSEVWEIEKKPSHSLGEVGNIDLTWWF